MEEVVWIKESSVGVLFGLVVAFCFFCGDRGIGIGDMEWGISRFLGGCCFVAATLTSSASGDNVGDDNVWGVVLWGMWCKWKSFIVNWDLAL